MQHNSLHDSQDNKQTEIRKITFCMCKMQKNNVMKYFLAAKVMF